MNYRIQMNVSNYGLKKSKYKVMVEYHMLEHHFVAEGLQY